MVEQSPRARARRTRPRAGTRAGTRVRLGAVSPRAVVDAAAAAVGGQREPRRRALIRARRSSGVLRGRVLPVQRRDRGSAMGRRRVQHLPVLGVVQLDRAVGVAGHQDLTVGSPPERGHGRVGIGGPQPVLALAPGLVPVQPAQRELPVARGEREEVHGRAPRRGARGSEHVLVMEERERLALLAEVGVHRGTPAAPGWRVMRPRTCRAFFCGAFCPAPDSNVKNELSP